MPDRSRQREASQIEPFGALPDGRQSTLYTLEGPRLRVRVTDFGGRIVSIEAPDGNGVWSDVLLGFDDAAQYASAGGSFGALLGRTANRIANGCFSLDGRVHELSKNEDGTTLHGGAGGFEMAMWGLSAFDGARLEFHLVSPDGDQGFPGDLSVRAIYRLRDDRLRLTLEADSTSATPVSLSAHPYFNLAGPEALDILDHEITIFADAFLPTDAKQIPTGEIRPVDKSPFDFRVPTPAGARIRQTDRQLQFGKGYDHYFVLSAERTLRLAARVRHPRSGRVLEIRTTQPGLQFYTGNNLNGSVAGRGGAYRQSAGFALEPQGFPNAPNEPRFPSTILRPGMQYSEVIEYRITHE